MNCANIKIYAMTQMQSQEYYEIEYKINNEKNIITNINSLTSAIHIFFNIAKTKEKSYYYKAVMYSITPLNKKVILKQNLTLIGANNGL